MAHSTEMPTSSLFLLPDLLRNPWLRRGIDRLRVISGHAARATLPAELTVDAALAKLSQAGLACGRGPGERVHILGGTSAFLDCGIRGFERPFMILEEPEGHFTAAVAGVRPFADEEVTVATLTQAVEFILRVYRDRGMLSAEVGR
ncbi:hypothetical protein [Polyangium jinanense]|uniref:Uncharacterized protein n=1 Tax=Polyangium jinanense TaxID=2829994 RepID=A0A9X3WX98_9BACT|nr:hypothetical protein [Polyangium jinanense]MDC3953085.1 hypothetical protein [Polyangium jinanense]MDC3979802.1 hypothetical protein [Polyangium jinanense]